jgi:hypothetical protein
MALFNFVLVVLVGLSINSENAAKAGRPVENVGDLKVAIEKTVDDVKSRDKFESFELNQ